MCTDYRGTIKYWNKVFSELKYYNPHKVLAKAELEDGVRWVSEGSKSVLDFGFGTGKVLYRCLDYGVENICGIDISKSAVRLASDIANTYNLEKKTSFITGGLEAFNDISDDSYDAAILFNVLDNLSPKDGEELIKQVNRVVKPNGKVLVKLNPYIEEDKRIEYGFKEISDEFYLEKDGVYIWNLTDEKFKACINPYFNLEKYIIVEFKEYGMINRMYYLKNNK